MLGSLFKLGRNDAIGDYSRRSLRVAGILLLAIVSSAERGQRVESTSIVPEARNLRRADSSSIDRTPSKGDETRPSGYQETASSHQRVELWTVGLTAALVGATILQFLALVYQAHWLRKNVKEAQAATQATGRAADAARDSAQVAKQTVGVMTEQLAAMHSQDKRLSESVDQMRASEQRQLRAYVSVAVGTALFQDRANNLRFEARPQLVNTGRTPAHDVRSAIRADILPLPLTASFKLAPADGFGGGAVLGPQQTFILHGVVADFADDADVEDIKVGKNGRALCAWGTVTYKDVFGVSHHTDFAQSLIWLPNGNVYGYYAPIHNDAD